MNESQPLMVVRMMKSLLLCLCLAGVANVLIEKCHLQFEDLLIEVPWGHVAGRWYGNRNVRPILALHGWMDNLGTWDRLIPLMPRHIGVLCIDLPGHGRSSKYPLGQTYHVFEYVHIIIRVIKEYKWRRVSLMGHSMGAIVCYHYAALYPHMVDMLIQIDLIKSTYHPISDQLMVMRLRAEKLIIENERMAQWHTTQPPCYSYEELEEAQHKGGRKSVDKRYCKHLLNRSIANAEQHPFKFYFSRDPRIKYYVECSGEHDLGMEMARRICNTPYMIARSDTHSLMTEIDEKIVEILRANNPHFEYHRLKGTHHLHLNNPENVAAVINPFILRHRPMNLDKWSLDDNVVGAMDQAAVKSKL